jgi:hypothetical protein
MWTFMWTFWKRWMGTLFSRVDQSRSGHSSDMKHGLMAPIVPTGCLGWPPTLLLGVYGLEILRGQGYLGSEPDHKQQCMKENAP